MYVILNMILNILLKETGELKGNENSEWTNNND